MIRILGRGSVPRRRVTLRAAAVGLCGVLALSAAACSSGSSSTSPKSNSNSSSQASGPPINFSVGVFPVFVSLPIWVGLEEGIFTKHGLNVTTTTIGNGAAMTTALASESIDAIVNGPTGMIPAIAKGLSIKMISVIYPHSIYYVLASNQLLASCQYANQPYPKPILCAKGKRLGIIGGVGTESYTVALSVLHEVGLTEQDVTLVPIGGGEAGGSSMQAGQIDIQFAEDTAAAYTSQVLKVGKDLTDLRTQGTFANWVGEATWAMSSKLKQSPAAYEKFAAATDEAVAWIQNPANESKLAGIFKKYANTLQQGTVDYVAKNVQKSFGPSSNCGAFDNMMKWLVATNALQSGQAPSCKDLLSPLAHVSS